ncbi:LAQU0S03e03114g1_1 [Lachancea quebecensis]|uniref:LAQU0S03e03114g1_1 n=1 Tax=Lachancea quebecensis TaxID=1654605 RepID=A0A0P1KYN6_9SACH|nr:LAQU0S03e03114g1_1 [Lachancea quebecensis]
MSLNSSIWASSPTDSEDRNALESQKNGLKSSMWANSSVPTTKKKSRRKSSSGDRKKESSRTSKQEKPLKPSAGNALAARLGMLDLNKSQDSLPKQEVQKKNRRGSSSQRKNSPNPLAARLGIVEGSESGEDSDSEDVSRPSTSDKKSIFDRIKPKKDTKSDSSSERGSGAGKQAIKQCSKMELLKQKVEEQRRIKEVNQHKSQQTELLKDFLNDDAGFNWEDEL